MYTLYFTSNYFLSRHILKITNIENDDYILMNCIKDIYIDFNFSIY
jgi:hypothetical protein